MYKLLAIVLVIGLAGLSSGQRRGSGWRMSDWESSDCRSSSQGCPCTRSECQQGSSDNYGRHLNIDSTSQHRFGGSNGWTTKDMDSSAPRRSNQAQSPSQSHFGSDSWTTKDMDSSAPRRSNQAQSSSQIHFGSRGWTKKDMDSSAPRRISQDQSSSQSHFGSGGWTMKDMDSSASRRTNQAQSSNQHRFGSSGWTSTNSDSASEHGLRNTGISGRHGGNMSQGGYGTSNMARKDVDRTTKTKSDDPNNASQRRTGQRRYNSSTFSWELIGTSSGDRNRPGSNRMSAKDMDSTSHYGYGENSMESTMQHGDFSLHGKQDRFNSNAASRVDRYGRNRY